MDFVAQVTAGIKQIHQERTRLAMALRSAPATLSQLHSGAAAFDALKNAVQELSRTVPDKFDVLVKVGNLSVHKARFIEPHTFSFDGITDDGHRAWTVIHFSQLEASIGYQPKRGPNRVVTEFSNVPSA